MRASFSSLLASMQTTSDFGVTTFRRCCFAQRVISSVSLWKTKFSASVRLPGGRMPCTLSFWRRLSNENDPSGLSMRLTNQSADWTVEVPSGRIWQSAFRAATVPRAVILSGNATVKPVTKASRLCWLAMPFMAKLLLFNAVSGMASSMRCGDGRTSPRWKRCVVHKAPTSPHFHHLRRRNCQWPAAWSMNSSESDFHGSAGR